MSASREPESPLSSEISTILRGNISWSGDEFWEIVQFEAQWVDTALDDGTSSSPLSEHRVGSGIPFAHVRFNPDRRLNAVMRFMATRYAALDLAVRLSHMHRYHMTKEFMRTHRRRLIRDAFIVADADGVEEVPAALFDVLAEFPYAMESDTTSSLDVFDYLHVTAEAWRRMAAEYAAGEGTTTTRPAPPPDPSAP